MHTYLRRAYARISGVRTHVPQACVRTYLRLAYARTSGVRTHVPQACVHTYLRRAYTRTSGVRTHVPQACVHTYLRHGLHVQYMHSLLSEVSLDRSVGHEGQDNVGRAVRGIEAHAHQPQNVGVLEVLHDQTLCQKCTQLLL